MGEITPFQGQGAAPEVSVPSQRQLERRLPNSSGRLVESSAVRCLWADAGGFVRGTNPAGGVDVVTTGPADVVVRMCAAPRENARCGLDGEAGPDVEILVRGWEVSLPMLRIGDLEAPQRRDPVTDFAHRPGFTDQLRLELELAIANGT